MFISEKMTIFAVCFW